MTPYYCGMLTFFCKKSQCLPSKSLVLWEFTAAMESQSLFLSTIVTTESEWLFWMSLVA
jgi:hypothetical protein